MKLAQFRTNGSPTQRLGVLSEERLFDPVQLAQARKAAGQPVAEWILQANNLRDVLLHEEAGLREVSALVEAASASTYTGIDPAQVEFLPPVYPGKIIAIGLNYRDHAAEGGHKIPSDPLLFAKLTNALTAHNAPILLPAISQQIDYEVELAIIIGKHAKQVSEARAMDYVFGYAPFNDVTARDLQLGDGQWIRGKGLDTFAPLGPYITTRDEVPDPHNLKIEGRLNGQIMQSSNTCQMIFGVPYLISYISQAITLEPGDVIATGTPPGIGHFRNPPTYFKDGDVFEVTIDGLGTLRNPVRNYLA